MLKNGTWMAGPGNRGARIRAETGTGYGSQTEARGDQGPNILIDIYIYIIIRRAAGRWRVRPFIRLKL